MRRRVHTATGAQRACANSAPVPAPVAVGEGVHAAVDVLATGRPLTLQLGEAHARGHNLVLIGGPGLNTWSDKLSREGVRTH